MSLINKGPSIITVNNDKEAISLINRLSGNNYTTIENALLWVSTQDDIFVQNQSIENIITDGLILYLDSTKTESYSGSGNTWYDISGNNNNGNIIDNPNFDGYFNFNGNSNYILLPTITLSKDGSTFSSWIYVDDFITSEDVPSRILIGNTSYPYQRLIALYDGGYGFETNTNSDPSDVASRQTPNHTSTDIITGKWFHFAMVFNNNTSFVYVNGDLVDSISILDDLTIDNIGYYSTPNNYPDYMKGKINNVKIYNRSLSGDEILQNYNSTKSFYFMSFGYDMENSYSYIGEPTTNYLSDGLNGYNAFNTSYWKGASLSNIGISEFDTPIFRYNTEGTSYTYTNDYILDDDLTTLSNKTVTFSLYLKRLNSNATGNIRIYDNVSGYSNNYIEVTTSFKKFEITKTLGIDPTRIFVMIDDTGGGIYEFHSTQLEINDHASQFVDGSRSNTEGLLDLINNVTLDLSNVSFDSNSNFYFDGSGGIIGDWPSSLNIDDSINPRSWEVVAKPYISHNSETGIFGHKSVDGCTYFCNGGIYIDNGNWKFNWYDNSTYRWLDSHVSADTGNYYHIISTFENGDIKIYVNGELKNSYQSTYIDYSGGMNRYSIGCDSMNGGSRFFSGEIPVCNFYETRLTEQEIKYKYDILKDRFNLI